MIEKLSNELLAQRLKGMQRQSLDKSLHSDHLHTKDLMQPYITGLVDVINMAAIQRAGLKLG